MQTTRCARAQHLSSNTLTHHVVADLAAKVHALAAAAGRDAVGLELGYERRHIDKGIIVRLHDEAHVVVANLRQVNVAKALRG